MPRSAVAVALLLACSAAPTAASASSRPWTPPVSFTADPPGPGDLEAGAPRVGVAADGTSVMAFRHAVGSGRTVRRDLRASVGDRHGRFEAPVVLTRAGHSSYSAAARPGGDRLVAWSTPTGLRAALHRDGRWLRRTLTTDARSGIDAVQVAADPRGGWVLVVSRFAVPRSHVEALTLSPDGTRAGPPQVVGEGSFGNEARPVFALAVDRFGTATVAFRRDSVLDEQPYVGTRVAVRPHSGAFTTPVALDDVVDARVTPDPAGGATLAATKDPRRGDAASFGPPVAGRVAPDGTVGPLKGPDSLHPDRAFGPSGVALGPDRLVLVHSRKSAPAPFSNLAPVVAETLFPGVGSPDVRTLTGRDAAEPVTLPVLGRRALVLWSGARGWGDVLLTATGRRVRIASPPGPAPTRVHSNATNRDARSAGPYAVLTWERSGRVRVSVRRF